MSNHFSVSGKNTCEGFFIITGYNKKSNCFLLSLIRNNEVIHVGEINEGISEKEAQILKQVIEKNKIKMTKNIVYIDPSICVSIRFKEIKKGKLVHPFFLAFHPNKNWEECTFASLYFHNESLIREFSLTSLDKPLWEEPFINKDEYLVYLFHIAPYMMPFLRNRPVTTIRFPHGIGSEAFYQKNCPTYAPAFVQTYTEDGIQYIVCEDLSTLIWLGNQLALEFHIPFHEKNNKNPREIVFDLDPPSREYFHLAVKAAKEMKVLFDKFQLTSFPKLSGNKGIQISLPLKGRPLTYEDARIFTSFVATYLVEKFPKAFSIERMKKKRANKLYIDYVQHWDGKTIICPYSTRGIEGATVATPLFWEEVNDALTPATYDIFSVMKRIDEIGCPFENYFDVSNEELIPIIQSIRKNFTPS